MRNDRNQPSPDDDDRKDDRGQGVQLIGEVLEELLAQYEARFPQLKITVVEQPTAAV